MAERQGRASTGTTALSSDLVGRDVELAHLREALDAATAGYGSVQFLMGEAGIGKSRLARAVALDAASRGQAVLWGRAVQAATPTAYRPFAEALSSAVRVGAVPDAPDLVPFRATIGRLVLEWRGDDEDSREQSVVAVAEAVLRFLRATAGDRGVLLVLEDLHWADPETLTILEYLAHNLVSERALCLVTVRGESRSPAVELTWRLHASRVSPVLQLVPLGPHEVATMLASCLGSASLPDQVVRLAARADGVPFMVEELLAAALSSGSLVTEGGSWRVVDRLEAVIPPTFAESLRRRVRRLGDHCEAVIVAAAVLGRRFEWNLLPAMTGLANQDVLGALHEAVDAQIVSFERSDGSFRFRHALSRDAVLAGLFPPERQALSRRAVDAIESAFPDLQGHWCELAAELAAAAGDHGRAATLLLQVAHRAFRQGALATAEATLDRARSLLPVTHPAGLDVDEYLLQVLSLAGKRERAVEVATSLLARLAHDPRWARRRAEIQLRLARAAVAATRWEEAQALLEQALQETAAVPEEDLAARVDAVRAQAAIMSDPEQARALAEAALQRAERLGLADVACEALEVLGRTERRRNLRAAENAFARALAVAEASDLTPWRARALHELATIDMLCGRGVERLEEARALALAQGALATAAVVDVQIAAALVLGDDPRQAVVATRRSAELARRYRFDQTLAAALALEAHAHARLMRRDEMQRCIDQAVALAPGVADIEVKTSLAAAVLGLAEEDRAAARRHLAAAVLKAASGRGGDYSAVPALGLLALVRQLDGGDDEAAPVEMPTESVHFMNSAFFGYADAVAAGRRGDADLAVALVVEGDRRLDGHQWLRHLGRRLVAEAAVAHEWGAPVAWLREALAFFDGQRYPQMASACRSILRRAGVAVPRRRGETGVPGDLLAIGVTSREMDVLRLLARGLPTREIAARLYLSPRTVERHVANLALKTGVGRRSELVVYAARTVGGDVSPP